MQRTISVCDHESDVYEYLLYKCGHDQRFVVRAQVDRRLLQSDFQLFETLDYEASALWCYTVQIPQRGGRRAREAKLLLRSATVELLAPAGRAVEMGSLSVNVVLAEELNAPAQSEPLRWVLLTTEVVSSAEEARQIVRYYELRWRIEDYHKAWKSASTDINSANRRLLSCDQETGQSRGISHYLLTRGVTRRMILSPSGRT